VPNRAIVEVFVGNFRKFIGHGNHNVRKKHGVGTAAFCSILCLFHLGSSDHLHGSGDLAGAFNPLDPQTNIPRVGHILISRAEKRG